MRSRASQWSRSGDRIDSFERNVVAADDAPPLTPDDRRVTHDQDDFSFLPAQAAALGAGVPRAARLDVAAADGRNLSAVAYGDGAPRVVLLHGAGLNAHTWDATAIALGAPVLTIDLPGHGDSSWREDADYSPWTLAPDVVRLIEAGAEAPVVLVGQSLGGLTAAAVAAARPDLVSRLVLIDIAPSIGEGGPELLRRFYERREFSSRDELLDYAVSFGLGGSRDEARRGVHLNSRVRPDGVVEWKHHFAHLADHAFSGGAPDPERGWRDLERTAAPVTLVRGTNGFIDEDALRTFRARLPRADVVELDAPHNIQEVAPVALAELISSLTSSTDPAKGTP